MSGAETEQSGSLQIPALPQGTPEPLAAAIDTLGQKLAAEAYEEAAGRLQKVFGYLLSHYVGLAVRLAHAQEQLADVVAPAAEEVPDFDLMVELLGKALDVLTARAEDDPQVSALFRAFFVGGARARETSPRRHARLLNVGGIPIRGYRLLHEWCVLEPGTGDLKGKQRCLRDLRRYLPILKEWVSASSTLFALEDGHSPPPEESVEGGPKDEAPPVEAEPKPAARAAEDKAAAEAVPEPGKPPAKATGQARTKGAEAKPPATKPEPGTEGKPAAKPAEAKPAGAEAKPAAAEKPAAKAAPAGETRPVAEAKSAPAKPAAAEKPAAKAAPASEAKPPAEAKSTPAKPAAAEKPAAKAAPASEAKPPAEAKSTPAKPAAAEKPAAKAAPAGEAKPAAKVESAPAKPAAAEKPAAKAAPAGETKPAAKVESAPARPAAAEKPAAKAAPAGETKSAAEAKSAPARPAAAEKPAAKAAPAGETKSAAEAKSAPAKPAAEEKPAAKAAPASEAKPPAEAKSAPARPAAAEKPAAKAAPAGETKPATEVKATPAKPPAAEKPAAKAAPAAVPPAAQPTAADVALELADLVTPWVPPPLAEFLTTFDAAAKGERWSAAYRAMQEAAGFLLQYFFGIVGCTLQALDCLPSGQEARWREPLKLPEKQQALVQNLAILGEHRDDDRLCSSLWKVFYSPDARAHTQALEWGRDSLAELALYSPRRQQEYRRLVASRLGEVRAWVSAAQSFFSEVEHFFEQPGSDEEQSLVVQFGDHYLEMVDPGVALYPLPPLAATTDEDEPEPSLETGPESVEATTAPSAEDVVVRAPLLAPAPPVAPADEPEPAVAEPSLEVGPLSVETPAVATPSTGQPSAEAPPTDATPPVDTPSTEAPPAEATPTEAMPSAEASRPEAPPTAEAAATAAEVQAPGEPQEFPEASLETGPESVLEAPAVAPEPSPSEPLPFPPGVPEHLGHLLEDGDEPPISRFLVQYFAGVLGAAAQELGETSEHFHGEATLAERESLLRASLEQLRGHDEDVARELTAVFPPDAPHTRHPADPSRAVVASWLTAATPFFAASEQLFEAPAPNGRLEGVVAVAGCYLELVDYTIRLEPCPQCLPELALDTEFFAPPRPELASPAETPNDPAESLAEPADLLGPAAAAPDLLGPAAAAPDLLGPAAEAPDLLGPAAEAPDLLGPAAEAPDLLGPAAEAPDLLGPAAEAPDLLGPAAEAPDLLGPAAEAPDLLGPAAEATEELAGPAPTEAAVPEPALAAPEPTLEVTVPENTPEPLAELLGLLEVHSRPAERIARAFSFLIQYYAGLTGLAWGKLTPRAMLGFGPRSSLLQRARLLEEAAAALGTEATAGALKAVFFDGATQRPHLDNLQEIAVWCGRVETGGVTSWPEHIEALRSWLSASADFWARCEHFLETPAEDGRLEVVVQCGDDYLELVEPEYIMWMQSGPLYPAEEAPEPKAELLQPEPEPEKPAPEKPAPAKPADRGEGLAALLASQLEKMGPKEEEVADAEAAGMKELVAGMLGEQEASKPSEPEPEVAAAPPELRCEIGYEGKEGTVHRGFILMQNEGGGSLKGTAKSTHPCLKVSPGVYRGNGARLQWSMDEADQPSSLDKVSLLLTSQTNRVELSLKALLPTQRRWSLGSIIKRFKGEKKK